MTRTCNDEADGVTVQVKTTRRPAAHQAGREAHKVVETKRKTLSLRRE